MIGITFALFFLYAPSNVFSFIFKYLKLDLTTWRQNLKLPHFEPRDMFVLDILQEMKILNIFVSGNNIFSYLFI